MTAANVTVTTPISLVEGRLYYVRSNKLRLNSIWPILAVDLEMSIWNNGECILVKHFTCFWP